MQFKKSEDHMNMCSHHCSHVLGVRSQKKVVCKSHDQKYQGQSLTASWVVQHTRVSSSLGIGVAFTEEKESSWLKLEVMVYLKYVPFNTKIRVFPEH